METNFNTITRSQANANDPVVTSINDITYLSGMDAQGNPKKITPDNFLSGGNVHASAWGVIIPAGGSLQCETVGNYDLWREYKEQIGRYAVTLDGSKAYKLNPLDSNQFLNGTPVDWTQYHCMVHFPDLYYKVEKNPNTGIETIWMSTKPIGGHPIHTSGEGHGSWVGAYIGGNAGGKLVSRPDVNVWHSHNINEQHSAAQQNHAEFGIEDPRHRLLYVLMMLSEWHCRSIQHCLDDMTNDSWAWDASIYNKVTGKTASLGDACGNVSDGYSANPDAKHYSLFGVEDPSGWFWHYIQGVFCGCTNNGQDGTDVFLYEGNRMPSADELKTQPVGEFRKAKRIAGEGYVSKLTLGEYCDLFPTALGGSASTYWGDYHYTNHAQGQLVLFGAYSYVGSNGGLGCVSSHRVWSDSISFIAARLALYGQPVIMSDK